MNNNSANQYIPTMDEIRELRDTYPWAGIMNCVWALKKFKGDKEKSLEWLKTIPRDYYMKW